MKKSSVNKKYRNFVIMEGFWHMGKSSLVNQLSKKCGYKIIKEPNHLAGTPIKNPHAWYLKQHCLRHRLAAKILKKNGRVLMERSVLSSLAFHYGQTGKLSKKYLDVIKNIPPLNACTIFFLYGGRDFASKSSQKIKDKTVKNLLLKNRFFHQRYLRFYQKILNKITDANIYCVNVAPKGKFLTKDTLMKAIQECL